MGSLRDRKIIQSRVWLDPHQTPIPPLDYDYIYPITVYEAVRRDMSDTSTNLQEEIDSIYRLLAEKQRMIAPGIPGQLMTWTGIEGQIGALEVVKAIHTDPNQRSHNKIPTEKAIGDTFGQYTPLIIFNDHANNASIHLTDIERTRWNSMAPKTQLDAHISNHTLHITNEERQRWNNKADQSLTDDHILNINNPHHVTAHQVGTYTRQEIDDLFAALRDNFFNYMNIIWNPSTNTAEFGEYDPNNWNPNYVLGFNDPLPNVPDPTLTYFAIRPKTDYTVNETDEAILYIKLPGLMWQEVGSRHMLPGDMVITYPDTSMWVWMQGRFVRLFTDASGSSGGGTGPGGPGGLNGNVWKPTVNPTTGIITWALSQDSVAPTPVNIKGQDGYSPIKGVDYDDGVDGQGVPVGGGSNEFLVKLSNNNYDTTWKSLNDILADLVIAGSYLPQDLVDYSKIHGAPILYHSFGQNIDGMVDQKVVTDRFDYIANQINDILTQLGGSGGPGGVGQSLTDHLNDFNNPHHVTAAQIGAVTIAQFTDHINNFNNPHNVTKAQIGLGNVDNTSDMNKPVSNAVQQVINNLTNQINSITNSMAGYDYIMDAEWHDTTGVLRFTFKNGNTLDVNIPIADVFNSIYFDDVTKELVITLPDGSENRIDINTLIKVYYGSTGTHIKVTIGNDDIVKASIIPGSIGETEIVNSINLKGNPTTRTQSTSDRSTRIATTEFVGHQVIDNLISYEVDRPLSANMGRLLNQNKVDRDELIEIINDLENVNVIDNLESTNPDAALSANMGRYLDLVKAPRVHTSPSGSTFGQATISLFGHVRASEVDPLMDGTVFRGTDNGRYARADHRHPTDVTRAPIHWPDVEHNQDQLTGEPRAVIPPDDSNDNRIATTEWVRRQSAGINQGECVTHKTDSNKIVKLRSTYMDPVVFMRQIGTAVAVTFSQDDESGDPITTLDVEGTGPAEIIFGGIPLKNKMLGKNHTHLFVYDGICWRLINPVPGTGIDPPGGTIIGPGTGPGGPGGTWPGWKITYYANGGTIGGSEKLIRYYNTEEIGSLPYPMWASHTFVNWLIVDITTGQLTTNVLTETTVVTRDMYVVANWGETDHTVIFDCNGGAINGVSLIYVKNVVNNTALGARMPSNPVYYPHPFTEWRSGPLTPFISTTLVTKTMLILAVWDNHDPFGPGPESPTPWTGWTLVLYGNGGKVDGEDKKILYIKSGPVGTLPTAVWAAHTFVNWRLVDPLTGGMSATILSPSTIITTHMYALANWGASTGGKYHAVFDAKGGTVNGVAVLTIENITPNTSLGTNMPSDPVFPPSNIFTEWRAGIIKFLSTTLVNENKLIFAIWNGEDQGSNPPGIVPVRVLNKITSVSGFTQQGTDGTTDAHGQVDRVWFGFNYNPRLNDVEFTINNKPETWALRGGAGETIMLSNPVVVNVTRQSAMVQFTLERPYPSNSPVTLIQYTTEAWYNIKEII